MAAFPTCDSVEIGPLGDRKVRCFPVAAWHISTSLKSISAAGWPKFDERGVHDITSRGRPITAVLVCRTRFINAR